MTGDAVYPKCQLDYESKHPASIIVEHEDETFQFLFWGVDKNIYLMNCSLYISFKNMNWYFLIDRKL